MLASTKKVPQTLDSFRNDFCYDIKAKGHQRWTTKSGVVHHVIALNCIESPDQLARYGGPHNFAVGN